MAERRPNWSAETKIGKRIKIAANGCWIYGDNPRKYGTARDIGLAHRFVYETMVGPIPEGHHLHHTCETPACCNSNHLVPVTAFEHAHGHAIVRQGRRRDALGWS